MYYNIDKILKRKDEIFEFKYITRRTLKPFRKKVKIQMFTLKDREICKNCEYKELCAGECEKTIKGYDENHIPHID